MFDHYAEKFTRWIGSPSSIVLHTIIFILAFVLVWLGLNLEKVLLTLTTAVSLEAIYLAIFIQMTVNRNTESLEEVEEDIDEIQEDMTEIQDDIDEIQVDVDDIQDTVTDESGDALEKVVPSIQPTQNGTSGAEKHQKLIMIKQNLEKILHELDDLKKDHAPHEKELKSHQ